MEMKSKQKYGLFTVITMIVGIVIGSGIFFKADNVLQSTNGNVGVGILVFCLAALSIIFGSLTISSFAELSDEAGGLITYSEFISKRFACAFGWFQTFVYLPILCVVVSWVVGIYVCQVFGFPSTTENHFLIGIIWSALCFLYNIISPKLGGIFQNIATVIKIIPLFAIGVVGLVFSQPTAAFAASSRAVGMHWLSAVGPVAFAFDGWIVATTIAYEVKNSKRNVPRALILAPIFILAAYLLYFIGISTYLGPGRVVALGDESVSYMVSSLFGGFATKATLVFITISVMGTVNGLTMGLIRIPYALALRGMLPKSELFLKNKNELLYSGILTVAISAVWWLVHFFIIKRELLPGSDISELVIIMTYALYAILYLRVIMLYKKRKIKGRARGLVFPLLAIAGSGFIIAGGFHTAYFPLFALLCIAIMGAGYFGYKSRNKKGFTD